MNVDEGYTKFRIEWSRSGPLDHPQLAELSRWRRPLFDAGLIGQYCDPDIGYGNISARAGRQFIISGSQTGHLAELDASHYAVVTDFDFDANRVACRGPVQASSESMTHAAIYDALPQVNAIVHVHSDELWVRLKAAVPTTGEQVSYGTPEMAYEMSRLCLETDFPQRGVAVMAGHESGLVSIGIDVEEAATRILDIGARTEGQEILR